MSKRKLIARILGYTIGLALIVSILIIIGFVSGTWYVPFIILGASIITGTLITWIQINWDAN